MDITLTNPWQWQDSLGYSQAVEVKALAFLQLLVDVEATVAG